MPHENKLKKLALRIEQKARKTWVNIFPDMRTALMNDALFRVPDPQLAGIALNKFSKHGSTALEPRLPFSQLVEKIHHEDITITQIGRHKISTNSTPFSSTNNISSDIDNLSKDEVRTM